MEKNIGDLVIEKVFNVELVMEALFSDGNIYKVKIKYNNINDINLTSVNEYGKSKEKIEFEYKESEYQVI